MGSVADLFRSAWRDFVSDGIPSSGINNPAKSEIREIGTEIENFVLATAASSTQQPKDAARVASFTNVNLASGLVNGAVIDGVTVSTGQRVALGGQSDPAANGVYIVASSGAASRATDLNQAGEFTGATVYVIEGTSGGKTFALVPASTPLDLGTTAINLVQVSQTSPAEINQTNGPSSPGSGTTANADTTWVLAAPMAYDGYIRIFRFYAAAAGDVRIRRFTKSGDTFTRVGGDISVAVAAGSNTILRSTNDLPLIEVKAGEYLGIYARKAIVVYTASASAGHWSADGDNTDFTDSTLQTAQTLQFSFTVQQTPDKITEEKLSSLTGSINRGNQIIGLGRGVVPDITGSSAAAFTFVFRNPVVASGYISRIGIGALGIGTMFVKRFTRSGDTFTQVGPDYPVDVKETGSKNIDDLPYIPVKTGEYLGVFRGTASFAFLNLAGGINNYADPYFAPASSGNVTSFTDSTPSQLSLQINLQVQMGDIGRIDKALSIDDGSSTVVTSEPEYYSDTITSCEGSTADLLVTVTGTAEREGSEVAFNGSATLTATSPGSKRYDIIYLNMDTLVLGTIAGTQRTTDPTAFIPAITNTRYLPLFYARVVDSSISLTPLWRLRDQTDIRIADQLDLDRQRSRRCLPKFMAKVRNGTSIRILALGDSIQAIQSDTPSTATPNGVLRDVAAANGTTNEYLRAQYGDDVVDALPLYTSTALGRGNDGGGTIHTRFGFMWELVKALENTGLYTLGTNLYYDNFAIGGRSSADLVSSGTPTAWLTNAAAVANVDLVVVMMGMNERGDATSEERFAIIDSTLKAAGREVLYMAVPRPRSGITADWQFTNRMIRRVAEAKNSAFVSTSAISDDRFIGSLGIDAADLCAANGTNHPGIEEHKAYGRELIRTILD